MLTNLNIEKECMGNYIPSEHVTAGKACPQIFDGFSCWNETASDSIAFIDCPPRLESNISHTIWKECLSNGTWLENPEGPTGDLLPYHTTCYNTGDNQGRRSVLELSTWGYAFSIIFLSLSLVVYYKFPALSCTPVKVHKNLQISLWIYSVLFVTWSIWMPSNGELLLQNPWLYKVVHILMNYLLLAKYIWICCESLHPYILLKCAFSRWSAFLRKFLTFGWLVPIIPAIADVYVRKGYPSKYTQLWWLVKPSPWLRFPVDLSLAFIFIFSLYAIRIHLAGWRRSFQCPQSCMEITQRDAPISGTNVLKKIMIKCLWALRALLVILNLLELPFLLMSKRPADGSWQMTYLALSAYLTAYQGVTISLTTCFLSHEVYHIVWKPWLCFICTCKWFTCGGNENCDRSSVSSQMRGQIVRIDCPPNDALELQVQESEV